jgi:CHAD domain-containing protein
MSTDASEIEWQLDAIDLRPVVRFLEARANDADPGLVRSVATRGTSFVDVYLDTDDRRFERGGCALRVRRTSSRAGARAEAALVVLGNGLGGETGLPGARLISQQLAQPEPQALAAADGPVGERVRAVAGSKPLLLLFEVRTRRRRFLLEADGVAVGELALDETSIRPSDGGPPARLRRIEIDVPSARRAELEPVVDELREACGLQPALLSTFEAGLLSAGLGRPPVETFGPTDVTPASTIGEVAMAVLRRHFAMLRAREPGTRLGDDIEELHDMRVASRRLRAALSLFADVLPADVLKLGDELRWVGGVLGAVRDLDVQLEQLDSWLTELPEEDREPLLVLRHLLELQRATARNEMLAALDSRRYESFSNRFARALRAQRVRRSSRFSQAALAVAPDLIERRFRPVRKGGRSITADSPASDYHRLRIRAKRLRYALEFLADVYPGHTRPVVKRLVALQDVLGLHQDAVVAIDRLRHLTAEHGGELPVATIFAMGEVAGRYRESMTALEADFPALFAQATGKRWRAFSRHLQEQAASQPTADEPTGVEEQSGDAPARTTPSWPGLTDRDVDHDDSPPTRITP